MYLKLNTILYNQHMKTYGGGPHHVSFHRYSLSNCLNSNASTIIVSFLFISTSCHFHRVSHRNHPFAFLLDRTDFCFTVRSLI